MQPGLTVENCQIEIFHGSVSGVLLLFHWLHLHLHWNHSGWGTSTSF